jgi:hypothetical protein
MNCYYQEFLDSISDYSAMDGLFLLAKKSFPKTISFSRQGSANNRCFTNQIHRLMNSVSPSTMKAVPYFQSLRDCSHDLSSSIPSSASESEGHVVIMKAVYFTFLLVQLLAYRLQTIPSKISWFHRILLRKVLVGME